MADFEMGRAVADNAAAHVAAMEAAATAAAAQRLEQQQVTAPPAGHAALVGVQVAMNRH